jgi:hypothetical protein
MDTFPFISLVDLGIMADLAPNVIVEADGIAQQVVTPVADAPLKGIDFLLNVIIFYASRIGGV